MESHHARVSHHTHDAAGDSDAAAMIELLDLDAEVTHAYMSNVVAWVHEIAGDRPIRRILDLGSGTGTGALALLRHFELAEVVAVDISAPMLDRLVDKARDRGVADRIHTVRADLDGLWPAVDAVDLAWASNSLHHMADPAHALADLRATIRPGGLLVVAELDSFPRFLPDDLGVGRPGLESRCHAVMDELRAKDLPHLGLDWRSSLSAAGFTVEAERTFAIDLTHPLPSAAGRYAQASLRRMRSALNRSSAGRSGPGRRIAADDLATLDALIDSDGIHSVLRRNELAVHTARTVWVARRP